MSTDEPKVGLDPPAIYAAALRAIERAYSESGGAHHLQNLVQRLLPGAPGGSLVAATSRLAAKDQGTVIWSANKTIDDANLRAHIAALIAEEIRAACGYGPIERTDGGAVFAREGITPLKDLVSPAEAEEILGYFLGCTNVTRQETVLHHDVRDVVRAPHVFRIATDENVLSIASQHLGAPATMVQMDAWWSLPESEQPHGAQIFHRDRDDFRACKLFLYLSDVTSGDGPHIFVKGSHRVEAVTAALDASGYGVHNAGSFFEGNGRQVDRLIDQVFGAAVSEITGQRGTAFLENTFGFHRGKIPKTGRRCIFQALYAAIPYPSRLKRWSEADLAALPEGASNTPLARHAVRFAVNAPPAAQALT